MKIVKQVISLKTARQKEQWATTKKKDIAEEIKKKKDMEWLDTIKVGKTADMKTKNIEMTKEEKEWLRQWMEEDEPGKGLKPFDEIEWKIPPAQIFMVGEPDE